MWKPAQQFCTVCIFHNLCLSWSNGKFLLNMNVKISAESGAPTRWTEYRWVQLHSGLSLGRRHLVNAYEVKAGFGVIAGKTVWSMPERLECEVLQKERYINTHLPLATSQKWWWCWFTTAKHNTLYIQIFLNCTPQCILSSQSSERTPRMRFFMYCTGLVLSVIYFNWYSKISRKIRQVLICVEIETCIRINKLNFASRGCTALSLSYFSATQTTCPAVLHYFNQGLRVASLTNTIQRIH